MHLFREHASPRNGRFGLRYCCFFLFCLWLVGTLSLGFPSDSFALITGVAGDIAPRGNPDGKIDSADVILLERIVLGEITPTVDELLAGDVAPVGNPDGVLNMADVLVLQRAVLGEIALPPIVIGPPVPPDPAKIDLEIGDGQVTVIGTAGSVEPNTTVIIVNDWAEATVTVTANADGSFQAKIAARIGDPLSISVANQAGETSLLTDIRVLKAVILQPVSGVAVYGDSVWVSGMFWAPTYADISVNGATATTSGNNFIASVPLNLGTNTITAAVSIEGEELGIKHTITVISLLGVSPVQVTVTPQSGAAPLTVQFTAQTSSPSLQRVQIDFDNDGNIDFDSATKGVPPTNPIIEVYPDPGIYDATVTITDSQGNVHVSTHTITVGHAKDMMLRGIYQNMIENLRNGNIEGAVTAFSGSAQEKYRAIFTALQPGLPTVVNQLGTLEDGRIGEDWAEYVLLREENGESHAYLIYFMRGEDGVWRIDGM